MFAYSIILFATALLFMGLSIAIFKGHTNLIHDYHQTKVTDHAAYGKAFGKALWIITVTMFASGIVGLFGDSDVIGFVSVAVLIIGFAIGIGRILAVQKKYNNGLF